MTTGGRYRIGDTRVGQHRKATRKTLSALAKIVKGSGLQKHGETRDVLEARPRDRARRRQRPGARRAETDGAAAAGGGAGAVLDEIYSGPPKKGYVSLRGKKQCAMIGRATNTRVEVGLNIKDVLATGRLVAVPPGGRGQYKVRLAEPGEVDPELVA